ncbi:uncharacterized protein V6R79_022878 [Siganus canaliculatus]
MLPRSYFTFTFLLSLSFFSTVLSIECSKTQYAFPVDNPTSCCNKCLPGEYLVRRSSCVAECKPCDAERYNDAYNVKQTCEFCDSCNNKNMEYQSRCNATHNAVCRCKAGYQCSGQPCKECVPVPTESPLRPTTAASKLDSLATLLTTRAPHKPLKDPALYLVIIALLSIGITFLLVVKLKPILRWIRSKHGYFVTKPHAPVATCSEDEEVSKPVQEVCGKCDQSRV